MPEKLRNLISIESASNDGLGYPFLMLPILWMTYKPGKALSYWLTHTILWEVFGAVVLGAVIGYLAGYLLKIALSKKTIDESSYATYTVALALIVLASVKLVGADGILEVFAAGKTFSITSTVEERRDEDRIVEGIDLFFTIPIFTLLGLVVPWQEWMKFRGAGLLVAF
ncbi:cation:proton antiporter domain-containing protein [Methanosarcina horonobensis]|uniref:cation:proton antiporter domain-containing protein n=1 Tax=Methanosarcina horonobensis TaxID=418008 RepID=UPI0022B8B220|nr:cation:proton antiporter [Methanosarcina horonobensis]